MSFQEQLRHYREEAGYRSAKEFASLLEVPYTTYISYENKNREPRYNTLKKISRLLGVSIDVLLENTSNESDRAMQDLRACGFTVTKRVTANKEGKKPVYDVEWGKTITYSEEGNQYCWRENRVSVRQKQLLETNEIVNGSLKEMLTAIAHLKTDLYKTKLRQIDSENIYALQQKLFKTEPGFRKKIQEVNPELYKQLKEEIDS